MQGHQHDKINVIEEMGKFTAAIKKLSKDLGVHLIRIVSFSENGNYPMPLFAKGMMADSVTVSSAPAPELPTGENKITSNVTITYEIR